MQSSSSSIWGVRSKTLSHFLLTGLVLPGNSASLHTARISFHHCKLTQTSSVFSVPPSSYLLLPSLLAQRHHPQGFTDLGTCTHLQTFVWTNEGSKGGWCDNNEIIILIIRPDFFQCMGENGVCKREARVHGLLFTVSS